ncbi:MAG: prolyl oligopeptidase family serine peptidase [Elusimicrobia bacterium]|nr:prolyl oligopeptidase family serine peptidase [Elusimicrobiota bacterium]
MRTLALILLACLPALAADADWVDWRYEGLEFKTAARLRLLRNEVFARRGRSFESADLREHFAKQRWYKPDPELSEAALSNKERALVAELLERENTAPRTAAELVARGKAALAAPRSAYDYELAAYAAIELFTEALELEPDDVAALKGRAEAHSHLPGEWEAVATADLDRAIALAPTDADAFRRRGQWRLWSEAADGPVRALADCRKAVELDPKDAAAHVCAAMAHQEGGDRAQSEEAYAKAVALTPKDAGLRRRRAENLLRLGRLEEALGECDASLAIDPDDCLLYRAEILRGLHRDEEAARDQEKGGRQVMERLMNTGTAAAGSATAAGGLDVILSAKTLAREDQAALSLDGRRIAYTVQAPQDGAKDDARFLPNGTPSGLAGTRIKIADRNGSPAVDPCPSQGTCWRPSWSPDGKQLAYYSDADGAPRLWVFDGERPRRVADAPMRGHHWIGDAPLWTPDGRGLIVPLRPEGADSKAEKAAAPGPEPREYRSPGPKPGGNAGKAASDFYAKENLSALGLVDPENGVVRIVVSSGAEPSPSVARLSPSGRWLSYLSVYRREKPTDRRSVHDLAVVPVAGGAARVLAHGLPVPELDYFLNNYRWHPTEDRLVFLDGGVLREADFRQGRDASPHAVAAGPFLEAPLFFARDGKDVLVGSGPDDPARFGAPKPQRLHWVPLNGGPTRELAVPAPWTSLAVLSADERTAWQPVPGTLSVLGRDGDGSLVVLRYPAAGEPRELWRGRGALSRFANPVHDGGILARYEDSGTPPGLYWFDAAFKDRRRAAAVDPALDALAGGRSVSLSCKVPGGGKEISFALVLPPNAKPGPLPTVAVVYPDLDYSVLGDRFPASSRVADIPLAALTSAGYAVLLAHMRIGPLGKAGEPAREITEHLLPQVRAAAAQGFTDPARVAVLGHSYGGYAAAAVIASTDAFRAAVAISGMFDLGGLYGLRTPDGRAPFVERSEGGQHRMGSPPWRDSRRYLDNSPYYQAGKIVTPLLLIHGTEDAAAADAQKMFTALERQGKPAVLALYPGEGHSPHLWSRAHEEHAIARVLSFLKERL